MKAEGPDETAGVAGCNLCATGFGKRPGHHTCYQHSKDKCNRLNPGGAPHDPGAHSDSSESEPGCLNIPQNHEKRLEFNAPGRFRGGMDLIGCSTCGANGHSQGFLHSAMDSCDVAHCLENPTEMSCMSCVYNPSDDLSAMCDMGLHMPGCRGRLARILRMQLRCAASFVSHNAATRNPAHNMRRRLLRTTTLRGSTARAAGVGVQGTGWCVGTAFWLFVVAITRPRSRTRPLSFFFFSFFS